MKLTSVYTESKGPLNNLIVTRLMHDAHKWLDENTDSLGVIVGTPMEIALKLKANILARCDNNPLVNITVDEPTDNESRLTITIAEIVATIVLQQQTDREILPATIPCK